MRFRDRRASTRCAWPRARAFLAQSRPSREKRRSPQCNRHAQEFGGSLVDGPRPNQCAEERQGRGLPSCLANCSRSSLKGQARWRSIFMFELVSQSSQGDRSDRLDCFIRILSVGHHSRQFHDLCNPSAVGLLLKFEMVVSSHSIRISRATPWGVGFFEVPNWEVKRGQRLADRLSQVATPATRGAP
jgi:hypothetical protein